MAKKIDPIKGMHDLFETELRFWRFLETRFRDLCLARGYGEIRTPVLEQTELFCRGLGDTSAIVGKEMYTFLDKKNLSLTLRPEGTASVVRAYVGAGLPQQAAFTRLFYMGPMFRYEQPQKGRQRQFHQLGVEVFGFALPGADCEVIALIEAYFTAIGLAGRTTLLLNSIGCDTCRPPYLARLQAQLRQHTANFCAECQSRIEKNPLRVFDCKHPTCRQDAHALPKIADHLCIDCQSHWDGVRAGLDHLNIAYTYDPFLVRGLDYYTRTAFEWRAQGLGSQDAVGGGGRYDKLTTELGGPATPAIGVALGVERLLLALEAATAAYPPLPRPIAILPLDTSSQALALSLQTRLLSQGLASVTVNLSGASLKSQLRQASKDDAAFAIIIGETERQQGVAAVKNMQTGEQEAVPLDRLDAARLT